MFLDVIMTNLAKTSKKIVFVFENPPATAHSNFHFKINFSEEIKMLNVKTT